MLWTEENRLLNALSYWSSSDKVRTFWGGGAGSTAVQNLYTQGLSHIVIDKRTLLDSTQIRTIHGILAPYASRVFSNAKWDIYILEKR